MGVKNFSNFVVNIGYIESLKKSWLLQQSGCVISTVLRL